jgi:hypothetical protein
MPGCTEQHRHLTAEIRTVQMSTPERKPAAFKSSLIQKTAAKAAPPKPPNSTPRCGAATRKSRRRDRQEGEE